MSESEFEHLDFPISTYSFKKNINGTEIEILIGDLKNLPVDAIVRMPFTLDTLTAGQAVKSFQNNRYRDAYSYDMFTSDNAEKQQVEKMLVMMKDSQNE